MTTVAPSLLIESSSYLQAMRTCMKVWMSSTTTDSGVICPGASEKLMYNVVNTLAPSFFIRSSSFLQETRTTIKSLMSSNFSQIEPWTVEFLIVSPSFLQVTRTTIKSLMSSNFGQIEPWTPR